MDASYLRTTLSFTMWVVSQHHLLFFRVFHILVRGVPYLSIKFSFTRLLTSQYKPLLYEASHVSVWMSCFMSQYEPSFKGVPCLSVTFSSVRCLVFYISHFSTKLTFMRSLPGSWKRYRKRGKISDEQAKIIHSMNKSLTA